MSTIILDFDSAEARPEDATRDWMEKEVPDLKVQLRNGSVVLETDDRGVSWVTRSLQSGEGPRYLLWAVVPTANPAAPKRLKGEAFERHIKHQKQAVGLRTRLNTFPEELKERYGRSMTNPDYGHDD